MYAFCQFHFIPLSTAFSDRYDFDEYTKLYSHSLVWTEGETSKSVFLNENSLVWMGHQFHLDTDSFT